MIQAVAHDGQFHAEERARRSKDGLELFCTRPKFERRIAFLPCKATHGDIDARPAALRSLAVIQPNIERNAVKGELCLDALLAQKTGSRREIARKFFDLFYAEIGNAGHRDAAAVLIDRKSGIQRKSFARISDPHGSDIAALFRKRKRKRADLHPEEAPRDLFQSQPAEELSQIDGRKIEPSRDRLEIFQEPRHGGKIGKGDIQPFRRRRKLLHQAGGKLPEVRKFVIRKRNTQIPQRNADGRGIRRKIKALPAPSQCDLAFHDRRKTVLPRKRAAQDIDGKLNAARRQRKAAVKGERLCLRHVEKFFQHGADVDMICAIDIKGIARRERQRDAIRGAGEGNAVFIHLNFDVSRQLADAERTHDLVPVDERIERAVLFRKLVHDFGKIEREEVFQIIDRLFVLFPVERERRRKKL